MKIAEGLDNGDIVKAKKSYERYLDDLAKYKREGNEMAVVAEVAMEYFYYELNADGE